MHKVIGIVLITGVLISIMIWSTPVARLGSGFIVGDAQYILTYYDLVKESENIQIKFPNEDNIAAKPIYKNKTDNLVILKLVQPPKVKGALILSKEIGTLRKVMFFLSVIPGRTPLKTNILCSKATL